MSRKLLLLAGLGLSAALSGGDAHAAITFINGSFDTPADLGSLIPGAWTPNDAFLAHPEFNFRTRSQPRTGDGALSIGNSDEDPLASISHGFDDVVGEIYRVEFWTRSEPGQDGADPNGFLTVQVGDLSVTQGQDNLFRFVSNSFTFVGSAAGRGFDTLTISAATNFGEFIVDDVSITDTGEHVSGGVAGVPEPSSWALLISGFGLAGGALRRRRALLALA